MPGRIIQYGSNFATYQRSSTGLTIDNTCDNQIDPSERKKIFITNERWEALLRAVSGGLIGTAWPVPGIDRYVDAELTPNLRSAVIAILRHEGSID